jgi:hypothetical protein
MPPSYPLTRVYRLKNGSAQGWVYSIKRAGQYWHLYKFFSSRTAAINGMKHTQWSFGISGAMIRNQKAASMTVAKVQTVSGEIKWGVFQHSPHREYQITDANVGKYLMD